MSGLYGFLGVDKGLSGFIGVDGGREGLGV